MSEIKIIVGTVLGGLAIISFGIGIAESTTKRTEGTNGCAYVSIASFNPPFMLGCELFKKRFNLEK